MRQDFKKLNPLKRTKPDPASQATVLLEGQRLKKTPFRCALLTFFIEQDKPLTGLQAHEGMQKNPHFKKIKFDRATIFRNLKILVQKEILQTTEFGTGSNHFYLKSSHHHHHVFCVSCEMVEPIHYCGVAPMIEQANQIGFAVLSHRLDLIGLCPDCKR